MCFIGEDNSVMATLLIYPKRDNLNITVIASLPKQAANTEVENIQKHLQCWPYTTNGYQA
jgi:hypothetical protein